MAANPRASFTSDAPFAIPRVADGCALLNLGCGTASHPAFVNVDLVKAPGVITHDLRKGIPFPDQTFDLVYHSTMLSLMRPAEALAFTRECRRVLKPGGVLRVVTEDLERMCRAYLEKLEAACAGDRQSSYDYEWMMLELYDQATREVAGGGMSRYMRRQPLPNADFICSRVGEQGRSMIAAGRSHVESAAKPPSAGTMIRRFVQLLPARIKKVFLSALIGAEGLRALEIGRFRLTSGQVTYRMYDRYSLGELFSSAGFSEISVESATHSRLPVWHRVNLDLSAQGLPARPHALIMEGT
jgi:hypothetical protein